MIACDSSVFIAYLQGQKTAQTEQVATFAAKGELVFPPVVAAELLSSHTISKEVGDLIEDIPLLEVLSGYWYRVGHMRALLRSKKLKARLADVLIAQSCLDYSVPLITADKDFRHFAKHCGLKLL